MTDGLPAWRPGTQVRYWPEARKGAGQLGLTDGNPFVVEGVPVVHIAGHDGAIPLARVEWLGPPSTKSWWAFIGSG